jgi:hypothetical protein
MSVESAFSSSRTEPHRFSWHEAQLWGSPDGAEVVTHHCGFIHSAAWDV